MESEEREWADRLLHDTVLRRHGEGVARAPREPFNPRVEGTEGVREPRNGMPESSLEKPP